MTRILVAEDEAGLRAMIGSLLRHTGYHVEFAADGVEAIERLRTNDYDAILLDVMMPNASGFEVLAWMHRERRGAARDKVIILTALPQQALSNLTSERVFAVIRKPFDIEDVKNVIARCVSAPTP